MSITTSFFAPVQDDIREVEALMRSQSDGYQADLSAALDHLLSSGGKRVRPSLTLLTGRMLGADRKRLLTLAAAIELLHTATLVHDDLIDGSLLRRGISTLNSQWSPAATVLTGDFLFSRAAKLSADTESVPVMKLFAQTLTEIVNGEIAQLFCAHGQIDRKEYYQRIYAKTASLFQTSAYSASLLSTADREIQENLRSYGYQIGMAFQIMDDLFDFVGTQEVLGKPVGSDLRQGLITLPTIYYVEKHPDDPDTQDLVAGNCLENEEKLGRLIQSIRRSDAIELTRQEAQSFVRRGLDSLRQLPGYPERGLLEELAQYITERDS